MSAFNLAKRLQERRAAGGDEAPDIIDFMGDLTGKPVPKQAHDGLRSIVMTNDGGMVFDGVELTPTGLVFPAGGIERRVADALLDLLLKLDGSLAWMLGDMLVEIDKVWGVTYQYIAGVTGRDAETLHDYKAVADKVKMPLRNGILSWSHHKTVAYMDADAQRTWLTEAARNGWSVTQLKAAIAAAKRSHLPSAATQEFITPIVSETIKKLAKLTSSRIASMDADALRIVRQQHEQTINALARLQREIQAREQQLKIKGRW